MIDEHSAQQMAREAVTQVDRDAAADFVGAAWHLFWPNDPERARQDQKDMRDGLCDNWLLVISFARHRLAALASPPSSDGLREDFLSQLRRVNGERWSAWAGNDDPDPLYQANEFGGEAGEVLNVIKKLVRESRGWRGSRATIADLADEIADCLICLDSLARSYGIDLSKAVTDKFNATSEKQGFPHRLVALSTNPSSDATTPISDESLQRLIGELGNQIHNLGCEYQGNEALSERLEELRSEAWRLARLLASSDADALREALAWYGEQARLARLIHSEGDAGRHALAEDGGKRARAALQPSTGRG